MRKLTNYTLILALSALVISCGDTKQQSTQEKTPSFPSIVVGQKTLKNFMEYPATLEGVIHSSIHSKVSGYITQVLIEEGQKVKKGQTLFRIETNSLSQDAAAAQANIDAAQVEVERLKPLVERGIVGAVQLKTAESKLALAKANFQSITSSIDYAAIKSPVEGYVGIINFREGALVSPADPTPLTHVSVVDSLFAFFGLNEVDYLNFLYDTEGGSLKEKLAHFPPLYFRMVNGNTYDYQGKIKTVSGQVNRESGTVKITAIFPNPDQILSTGGSGEILIPRVYENATIIPEIATYEQQGKVYAYKVTGGKAIATVIEDVERIDGYVISEGGIVKGDTIIIQGINHINDQMEVNPEMISIDSIPEIKKVFK